jgi:hypothetical protein
MIGVTPVL